jgi:aminoglycoside phosphotransferase (APT) family kinase protein
MARHRGLVICLCAQPPAGQSCDVDSAGSQQIVAATLARLSRERPDFVADPISTVDSGFSSFVLRTAAGYVVRIARTPEAGARHQREYELLQTMSGQLNLAVPKPQWRAEPTADIPYGATVYPWIEGAPLDRQIDDPAIAAQLATCLAQIHRLPFPRSRNVMPLAEWRANTLRMIEDSVAYLRADLVRTEFDTLRRWQPRIMAHVRDIEPALCTVVHGDFWHDNLLVRAGRLVGVVDWEGCAVADPAVDLAGPWYVNPRLAANMLRSYREQRPGDASIETRTRWFRVVREFNGLTWSVRNEDPDEYADSLLKVRRVLPLIGT